MNIVYFGSDVHYESFRYLLENHNILALYTYHNAEDYFTEYQIVKAAKEKNIPVHYDEISEEDTTRYFTEYGCELFFVAEYDRIIKIPETLDNFYGVNVHLSMLPVGRSYYPLENAMFRKLDIAGVTMHRLISGLDAGDILFQETMDINDDYDSIDLYIRASKLTLSMTKKLMTNFDECKYNAIKQIGKEEYWKRPDREFMTLSHEMTLHSAKQIIRTFNKMTEVSIEDTDYFVASAVFSIEELPTPVIPVSENMFLYGVKGGHLRLTVCKKNEEG